MGDPEALKRALDIRIGAGFQEVSGLDGETAYILGWEDAIEHLRRIQEPIGGVGVIEFGEVAGADDRAVAEREAGGETLPGDQ